MHYVGKHVNQGVDWIKLYSANANKPIKCLSETRPRYNNNTVLLHIDFQLNWSYAHFWIIIVLWQGVEEKKSFLPVLQNKPQIRGIADEILPQLHKKVEY